MYDRVSLLHDRTFCRGLDGELVTGILLRFGRTKSSLSCTISKYPLCLICLLSILKVFGLIDFKQGTWKEDLIYQYFNSYEVEEILNVPLCDDRPQDEQIWAYNKLGRFTVHLAYRLILQAKSNSGSGDCSSPSAITHFWTSLWGMYTAPNLKVLLWRLYNNILPTCKNLSRNISSIQSCCPTCLESVKDTLHIFFQCRVVEETWLRLDFSHLMGV